MRPGRWRLRIAAALLLGVGMVCPVTAASAHAPADEPEGPASGLIASFFGSAEPGARPLAVHIDPDLVHDWQGGSPDPRVPSEEFAGRWEGLILIQAPGAYRFHGRTDGSLRVTVGGRVALEGTGQDVGAPAVDLPVGLAALAVEYRHGRGPARLAIDWEGPGFARERVPARLLFHELGDGAAAHVDRFEEGRRLADRLGCANCHALLDLPRHLDLGPPLADAGLSIDAGWLEAWLADPSAVRHAPRMPSMGRGLAPVEVRHLAAFLRRAAQAPRPSSNEVKMALNVADPARGRLLFRSVGCLGCHSRGGPLADSTDRAAPDLADLGRKRGAAWLASFLARPKAGTPGPHRPDLRLDADQAAHLSAYLASEPPPVREVLPPGEPDLGRALADALRCASCHAIPGLPPRPADLPLRAGAEPDSGCLASEPKGRIPRFVLSDGQRKALRAFVAGLPRDPSPTPSETLTQDTIRRLNCLGCHSRDGQGGAWLGTQVAAALADDASLGPLKGTLTPPNLSAVGDKLRAKYLDLAIRGEAPTARPWLSVRMPTFAFAPSEADAIAAFLRGHDRIRSEPEPPVVATRPDAQTIETATTLIGQRGFGCLSCHVLAGKVPPGGEPETLGPDLGLAHRRMTEGYFHRWIANPQRIIPGTPMPQFLVPLPSVSGSLEDQLGAIWELLGSPRLAELAAFGTRDILKQRGDRAAVVRDMVVMPEAPDSPYTPRGLAIGFRNGHSLLFDTDRLAWVAWWRAGFLSRTKSGRLWEWHPEGQTLWVAPERGSPVVFLGPDGALVTPTEHRQRFGSFRELAFEGPGVAVSYLLNGPDSTPVSVEERIVPTSDGWERRVRVADVPKGFQPALAERPPTRSKALTDWHGFRWADGGASLVLRAIDPPPSPPRSKPTDPSLHLINMSPHPDGSFHAGVRLEIK